jgi:hypothetical protein
MWCVNCTITQPQQLCVTRSSSVVWRVHAAAGNAPRGVGVEGGAGVSRPVVVCIAAVCERLWWCWNATAAGDCRCHMTAALLKVLCVQPSSRCDCTHAVAGWPAAARAACGVYVCVGVCVGGGGRCRMRAFWRSLLPLVVRAACARLPCFTTPGRCMIANSPCQPVSQRTWRVQVAAVPPQRALAAGAGAWHGPPTSDVHACQRHRKVCLQQHALW